MVPALRKAILEAKLPRRKLEDFPHELVGRRVAVQWEAGGSIEAYVHSYNERTGGCLSVVDIVVLVVYGRCRRRRGRWRCVWGGGASVVVVPSLSLGLRACRCRRGRRRCVYREPRLLSASFACELVCATLAVSAVCVLCRLRHTLPVLSTAGKPAYALRGHGTRCTSQKRGWSVDLCHFYASPKQLTDEPI